MRQRHNRYDDQDEERLDHTSGLIDSGALQVSDLGVLGIVLNSDLIIEHSGYLAQHLGFSSGSTLESVVSMYWNWLERHYPEEFDRSTLMEQTGPIPDLKYQQQNDITSGLTSERPIYLLYPVELLPDEETYDADTIKRLLEFKLVLGMEITDHKSNYLTVNLFPYNDISSSIIDIILSSGFATSNNILYNILRQISQYKYMEQCNHQSELRIAKEVTETIGIEFAAIPESIWPGMPYLTANDIAKHPALKYTRQTILDLARTSEIPSVQIGRHRLFTPSAVARLLERQAQSEHGELSSSGSKPGEQRGSGPKPKRLDSPPQQTA